MTVTGASPVVDIQNASSRSHRRARCMDAPDRQVHRHGSGLHTPG